MDSKLNSLYGLYIGLIAVASSGLALYFGTGLHPVWWLTWLAPIPVLAAASHLSSWKASAVALAAWTIGGLNMWHYEHDLVDVPVAICLVALLVPSCVFALAVILFRRLVLRGALWQAAFILPALWVALEYLSEFRSPHSTFGNMGYAQMAFPPILQIASITGIWGISFCIFLFSSTVAALLTSTRNNRIKWRLARAIGLFFAVIFGYGAWRLYFTPTSPSVTVGLIASDVRTNLYPKYQLAIPVFQQYAARIDQLASQGAKIVIIPEKTAVVDAQSLAALDSILLNAAARNHIFILAGVLKYPGPYNESRLYSPEGKLVATYDKHHLVPQLCAEHVQQLKGESPCPT